MSKPEIILASGSPRRSAILTQAGIPHKVVVSEVEEPTFTEWATGQSFDPSHEQAFYERVASFTKHLAWLKVDEVVGRLHSRDNIVIGADTVLCFNRTVRGKPENREQALSWLKEYSKEEQPLVFVTGYCVGTYKDIGKSACEVDYSVTALHISGGLTSKTFSKILDSSQAPLDCAGAFGNAISKTIIESISGSWDNAQGMDLQKIHYMLSRYQVDLMDYII